MNAGHRTDETQPTDQIVIPIVDRIQWQSIVLFTTVEHIVHQVWRMARMDAIEGTHQQWVFLLIDKWFNYFSIRILIDYLLLKLQIIWSKNL